MHVDTPRWCLDVAWQRACRPLGGAAPAVVFAATERHSLRPLPVRPVESASWSRPRVGPDIHVKVGKVPHSVPWRFIGQHLDARATATHVQLLLAGELVKTHIAAARGKVTDDGDYPPEKIALHVRTPTWCRNRAANIGPGAVALIKELLEVNALSRLRAAQGVLAIAHTPQQLEAACLLARTNSDPTYQTVKGILTAGTDRQAALTRAAGDSGAPAHLRGPVGLLTDTGTSVTANGQEVAS